MITSTLKSSPNITSNRTSDPVVSPITASQLADYLALDYDPSMDAVLNIHLLAACNFYINYTSNELLQRDYVYKLDRWPEYGTRISGLSVVGGQQRYWLTIPVYPVATVSSIIIGGDDYTAKASIDLSSKPNRVMLEGGAITYGQIEMSYTAGYATAEEIPSNTLLGLYILAGYLYEHRGACAMTDAVKISGAKVFFDQARILVNL